MASARSENPAGPLNRALIGGGLLVGIVILGLGFLSQAFAFGVGHAERPIPQVVALLGLGWLGMWLGLRAVRSTTASVPSAWRLGWVLAISLLARLILLATPPIQETDPYRYLWDGNAVLHGVNPYLYPPSEAYAAPPTAPAIERWRTSINTGAAHEVHRRINHPGIPTVYPPAAQGLFALAQGLTPWSLGGWRFLVLFADLANLVLILGILSRARLPLEWVLLYGWSPLVLKEFGNSLHVDVFVVLGLLLMILALQFGRIRLSFLALALAGLVKLAPLLLMVPLAGWAFKRSRKQTVQGLAIAGLAMTVAYLPFLSAGPAVWNGLGHFVGRWRVNEGLYAGLAGAISRLGFETAWMEGLARGMAGVLLLLATFGIARWVRQGSADLHRLLSGMLALLSGLFLLLPMANPWYFTWVFPFLILIPVRTLIWLSGALGLYYLDFYFMYRGMPNAYDWVRLAEYGSVAMVAAWEVWRWRRSRSFFRFSTSATSLAAS